MVKIENRCCDCSTAGYPCEGPSCDLRNMVIFYCDNCGNEVDKLYRYKGEWCVKCILKDLGEVE